MIEKIKNDVKTWLVNRNEVGDALCNNIRNIMTSCGPRDLSIIEELIKHSVSSKGNLALVDIPVRGD